MALAKPRRNYMEEFGRFGTNVPPGPPAHVNPFQSGWQSPTKDPIGDNTYNPTENNIDPYNRPYTSANQLPWTRIFGDLDISRDYLPLLQNPTTYFPDMVGYEDEFKDANVSALRVKDLLSKLLGSGEGSLSEAERERTELVTGAYDTDIAKARQTKESGLGMTGEKFRVGHEGAYRRAGKDVSGLRGGIRKAKARGGFTGFGAFDEGASRDVEDTMRDFRDSILGLTTVRSQAEEDIFSQFGTSVEDLDRNRTAGMYNVRDVLERMKSGGADALMALIQQYIDTRNRILARGGGDGDFGDTGGGVQFSPGHGESLVEKRGGGDDDLFSMDY